MVVADTQLQPQRAEVRKNNMGTIMKKQESFRLSGMKKQESFRLSGNYNGHDSINELSFRKLPDEAPLHHWNTTPEDPEAKARRPNRKNKRLTMNYNGHDSINELSFRKLPDEAPLHMWNSPEKEAHNKRMKALDKQLAKYNRQVEQLKDALRNEDEKAEAQLARLEEQEQKARQDVVDLEQETEHVEKEAYATDLQFAALRVQLDANSQRIKTLNEENKQLKKNMRATEKQLDKIQFGNQQLEESALNLVDSLADLNESVDLSNAVLRDHLYDAKHEHQEHKDAVAAMHTRYMCEAQQRLEFQKKLGDMLRYIQNECKDPKLANACTKLGLDCEERYNAAMAELEERFD